MELRVNDYVRNCYGRIAKIKYIEDNIAYCNNWLTRQYEDSIDYINLGDEEDLDEIIKSSPDIIDLIEDKDLIKIEYKLATGQKQQEILEVIKNREEKLFVNSWIRKMFIEEFKYFDIEIKSIVTKEQFKSMEYKVKE